MNKKLIQEMVRKTLNERYAMNKTFSLILENEDTLPSRKTTMVNMKFFRIKNLYKPQRLMICLVMWNENTKNLTSNLFSRKTL